MKKFLLALVVLAPALLLAQAPPIQRNEFTTNLNVAARGVATNIVTGILGSGPTIADPIVTGSLLLQGAALSSTLVSDGVAIWSSGSLSYVGIGEGLEASGTQIFVRRTPVTVLAGTNDAAVTNILLGATNTFTRVIGTNNMTATNLAGVVVGQFHNAVVLFEPQLVNRTNCYPIGTQYGQTWKTNVNAPLFTTLTQGVHYVLSLTTIDTTVYASMSAWQP